MENKKTITVIASQFPVLSETFVVNQVKELERQGHSVKIISLFGSQHTCETELDRLTSKTHFITKLDPKSCSAKDKIKHILKYSYRFFSFDNRLALLGETFRLIKEKNYSAVLNNWLFVLSMDDSIKTDFAIAHFFTNGCYGVFMRLSGRLKTRKMATICHGNDMSHKALLAKWLPYYKRILQSTDYMWPISEFWKERLLEWGANEDSVDVFRMGIDSQLLNFSLRAAPMPQPIKVLSVGRATEKKGLLYAIRALSQLDFVDYQIIGDGECLPLLKEEIKNIGCTNIECMGSKPHSDVLSSIDEADVFLLPSVTAEDGDMEGIPVALMEAMAKGKIVISTYHSGIPELIAHEKTGFLCEERNVEDIISALTELKGMSLEELRSIQLAARSKIESEFDNKVINDNIDLLLAK